MSSSRARNRILLAAVVALLVTGGVWAWKRSTSNAGDSVLGQVTRGDLIQRVTIAGTVNPNRKTVIAAPYSGYVRKLFVKVGQPVAVGDPIVLIAQSLRGGAEEAFPLRAPFAGTVVQVLKNEGEYVDQAAAAGNGVVRIDDLTRLLVDSTCPEAEVEKLKVGQEAVIKASAVLSRAYKGKIQNISLAAREQRDYDRSRVEFPVLLEVSDADAQLKPGMSVILDIITRKVPGVLMLRHEFVQKDGDKYYVTLQDGAKREIQVGARNEDAVEVKQGVVENEKVRQVDFLSSLKEGEEK
jgi:multidrug efflux pump subunit AcrA (membrane-fusion protein)